MRPSKKFGWFLLLSELLCVFPSITSFELKLNCLCEQIIVTYLYCSNAGDLLHAANDEDICWGDNQVRNPQRV